MCHPVHDIRVVAGDRAEGSVSRAPPYVSCGINKGEEDATEVGGGRSRSHARERGNEGG